jgi:hypothetical protein
LGRTQRLQRLAQREFELDKSGLFVGQPEKLAWCSDSPAGGSEFCAFPLGHTTLQLPQQHARLDTSAG